MATGFLFENMIRALQFFFFAGISDSDRVFRQLLYSIFCSLNLRAKWLVVFAKPCSTNLATLLLEMQDLHSPILHHILFLLTR